MQPASNKINETEFLKNARQYAMSRKIPIIEDDAGRFLEAVCFIKKPRKILEIGCGTGYSTYFLIKHFRWLKTGKNFLYTGIDLNRERIKEAERYILNAFADCKNFFSLDIKFIHGNALKIIPDLKDRFDIVFIDAAKFEYPIYISSVEKNLKKGSIVIADNVYYSNKIFDEDIKSHDKNSINGIKKYLEYIKSCGYFETDLFDVADGISVSIHK